MPRNLEAYEDVKIVLTILSESILTKFRGNGFNCNEIEMTVRDNELFLFTQQIDYEANIIKEIESEIIRFFKENHDRKELIRSAGVRGDDPVADSTPEQPDLFMSFEQREKQMKVDA